MVYGYYSILYLVYYYRMVSGMRSSIRGHSLGCGRGFEQGRNASVHESIHVGPNQEEDRGDHVSEH